MKCRVNIKWRDKKTGEVHLVGEIVEITKTRYKEVCKVNPNVLEEVTDEPNEVEEPETVGEETVETPEGEE